METIKTARKAPGFYTATVNDVVYEIVNVGGTVADFGGWTWNVAGESADDIYSTKREAVAALTEWVASLAPVESKSEMMLRIKRSIDASNASRVVWG